MAVTVTVGGNPYKYELGKRAPDAVTITSGFSGTANSATVQYQIRRRDRTPWVMDGAEVLDIYSVNAASELITTINQETLVIVLPERQWFQVRARQGSGPWENWVDFKFYTANGKE